MLIKKLSAAFWFFSLAGSPAFAQEVEYSQALPAVREAIDHMREGTRSFDDKVGKVQAILESADIAPEYLERMAEHLSGIESLHGGYPLPAKDRGDELIEAAAGMPLAPAADLPKMALHAFRFDVIDKKGLFFGDDIYAYYFVTDGLVPQGKVTDIYKNVKKGQAFFFNEIDRILFPAAGIVSATPNQHLIIDMGIVESNKDDIAQMQKVSDVIIDLVIAVYGTQNPNTGAILLKLRQEIKALARELLALKKDDRLVTESFTWTAEELKGFFSNNTVHEFAREFKGDFGPFNNKFHYRLHFRALKEGT